MMAASIFPSGRLQTPDQHLWLLCICPALSSSLLPLTRLQNFIFTVTETSPQKVLQQGSVFKIGVYLQPVSKQSKKVFIHNAFQNKGLFPIILVTSRSYTVCAFPHSLSIAPSEPQPFPSLWLYKVCARATTLQHFGASRGESEAIPVLRDPHCSTKFVWLKPQSKFWQAAQLAAARILRLEETSPARGKEVLTGFLYPSPHLCRVVEEWM